LGKKMKIEIGKKYRTRGWWMAEVLGKNGDGFDVYHGHACSSIWVHQHNGMYAGGKRDFDLIAPWEEPAPYVYDEKTQTVRQIDTDTAAIRRQYACAALTGLIATTIDNEYEINSAVVAGRAFEIADAMMAVENDKNAC